MADIDLCVLTHTHSDHVGNLDALPASTRMLVSPEELVPTARSGRLLPKLPQDGRVQQTVREEPRGVFGPVMPLTERGDVFVMATPGHTAGHQSVVIDLGAHRIVIAGDAAFDDDQVAQGTIPGIVEQRAASLATYDLLNRVAREKPTLSLFTHDPANAAKLATFAKRG
jgi:glyoxylase-like metal-dependent hydrolase (beta-lactamase superfamily II)